MLRSFSLVTGKHSRGSAGNRLASGYIGEPGADGRLSSGNGQIVLPAKGKFPQQAGPSLDPTRIMCDARYPDYAHTGVVRTQALCVCPRYGSGDDAVRGTYEMDLRQGCKRRSDSHRIQRTGHGADMMVLVYCFRIEVPRYAAQARHVVAKFEPGVVKVPPPAAKLAEVFCEVSPNSCSQIARTSMTVSRLPSLTVNSPLAPSPERSE